MDNILLRLDETRRDIDWMKSISMFNTVSFVGYSLDEYNYLQENYHILEKEDQDALFYSAILLAIAGGHYAILDVNRPNPNSEIIIRYSDWLLTTPLLLKVLSSYYRLNSEQTNTLVIYNLIMIITGFIHEVTQNDVFWILGMLSYFAIIYYLFQYLKEQELIYKYFILGWGLYGPLVYLPPQDRLIYFNILDFYNKLIFAMDIRSKIMAKYIKKFKKNKL